MILFVVLELEGARRSGSEKKRSRLELNHHQIRYCHFYHCQGVIVNSNIVKFEILKEVDSLNRVKNLGV